MQKEKSLSPLWYIGRSTHFIGEYIKRPRVYSHENVNTRYPQESANYIYTPGTRWDRDRLEGGRRGSTSFVSIM